jgi:hypothetical protein
MRYLILCATGILAVCASTSSKAAYFDGNTLLAQCTGPDIGKLACLFYVSGVVDAHSDKVAQVGSQPLVIPPGVTPGQQVDVVVRFLNEHPQIRHWPASRLIYSAIRSVW